MRRLDAGKICEEGEVNAPLLTEAPAGSDGADRAVLYLLQDRERRTKKEPEMTTQTQEPAALEIPDLTPPEYDTDTVEALAKMVWGEARGCSTTEQAATVWCVLNRVDNSGKDILSVLLAPNQFQGYDYSNPVEPELVALVEDVLIRWEIEDECVGGVGRVLPKGYLWFTGDGRHNHFRNEYKSDVCWDWSLPSPYEGDR